MSPCDAPRSAARLALTLLIPALVALTVASATLSSASAHAQQRPSLREQVRTMLAGVEGAPDEAALAQLGEPGLDALIELASDPSELGVIRLRAITATSLFPGARARSFLADGLVDPSGDPLTLRALARAYVTALGAEANERTLAPVTRLTSHADAVVREGAFIALSDARTQAAPRARAGIERLLERCLQAERDGALARALRARLERARSTR